MVTTATLTFAAHSITIAPEEPASLSMALVGLGTLVAFAALSGWRRGRRRAHVAAELRLATPARPKNDHRIRYAA
jgi:hypothetical protein